MFYSDNPILDFDRHEYAKEQAIRKRPKCGICGEHIQGDWLYRLGNETFCEECFESEHREPIWD